LHGQGENQGPPILEHLKKKNPRLASSRCFLFFKKKIRNARPPVA